MNNKKRSIILIFTLILVISKQYVSCKKSSSTRIFIVGADGVTQVNDDNLRSSKKGKAKSSTIIIIGGKQWSNSNSNSNHNQHFNHYKNNYNNNNFAWNPLKTLYEPRLSIDGGWQQIGGFSYQQKHQPHYYYKPENYQHQFQQQQRHQQHPYPLQSHLNYPILNHYQIYPSNSDQNWLNANNYNHNTRSKILINDLNGNNNETIKMIARSSNDANNNDANNDEVKINQKTICKDGSSGWLARLKGKCKENRIKDKHTSAKLKSTNNIEVSKSIYSPIDDISSVLLTNSPLNTAFIPQITSSKATNKKLNELTNNENKHTKNGGDYFDSLESLMAYHQENRNNDGYNKNKFKHKNKNNNIDNDKENYKITNPLTAISDIINDNNNNSNNNSFIITPVELLASVGNIMDNNKNYNYNDGLKEVYDEKTFNEFYGFKDDKLIDPHSIIFSMDRNMLGTLNINSYNTDDIASNLIRSTINDTVERSLENINVPSFISSIDPIISSSKDNKLELNTFHTIMDENNTPLMIYDKLTAHTRSSEDNEWPNDSLNRIVN